MTNPETVQDMVRRRVRRRRQWRRARLTGLVAMITIGVGAGAFGIDRMVVALQKYYAEQPHPHRDAGATTTTGPATTTATGPPNCVSGQLSGSVSNWQGISGTMFETVVLTNISLSPCMLRGYPGLGVNSQNGTALPAATRQVSTMGSSTGEASPTPARVVLPPEGRAWFELSYPDVCNQILTPGAIPTASPNVCYEGKWLQITPPRTASPLLVPEPLRFTYGTAGFDVGPFGAGSPPPLPRS